MSDWQTFTPNYVPKPYKWWQVLKKRRYEKLIKNTAHYKVDGKTVHFKFKTPLTTPRKVKK